MFIDWKMHFYSIPRLMLQSALKSKGERKYSRNEYCIENCNRLQARNRIIRFAASRAYAFGKFNFFFTTRRRHRYTQNGIVLFLFRKRARFTAQKKSTGLYIFWFIYFSFYSRTQFYNTDKHSLLATRHSFYIIHIKLFITVFPFWTCGKTRIQSYKAIFFFF